jgi:exodeoxyribonuclease VII small subunit
MAEPSAAPIRFEQALAELDRTLRELEDGTTTLEEALARYERGVELVRLCYTQLRDAEQRIRELAGLAEDGKPILRTFDHTATVDKEKPKASRRNGPPIGDGAY